jgi:hypothetical protein
MFKQAMDSFLYDEESRKKWAYDYGRIRERAAGAPPITCEFMNCPHIHSCNRRGYKSCAVHIPKRKGEIRRTSSPTPGQTLAESRHELEIAWQTAYSSDDHDIHLILVDTGVGKTHTMLNTPLTKTMVAAPTHLLKEQHGEDYKHGTFLLWPMQPSLPDDYAQKIAACHASGVGNVKKIIEQFAENSKDAGLVKKCHEYLAASVAINNAQLVFCTHEKVFNCNNTVIDTIIFDEDPISAILKTIVVQREDLRILHDWVTQLMDRGENKGPLEAMAGKLASLMTAPPGLLPESKPLSRSFINGIIGRKDYPALHSPVHSICLTSACQKGEDGNFTCIEVRRLPGDKKVIILSASANVLLYQKLFGDRVKVTDLRGTALRGRIYQHNARSYSKSFLQKLAQSELENMIKKDVKQYRLDGVITYKQLEKVIDGKCVLGNTDIPMFTHYGAQYGLNQFQGKNTGVYGVPHKTDDVYKLLARAVGFEATGSMRYQTIDRNGYEFEVWTYDNLDLRELQLCMIEGEYLQAVGRARLVSNDCDVHVFSNYPVPKALLEGDEKQAILPQTTPSLPVKEAV